MEMVDYSFACIVRPEYRTAFPNTQYYSPDTPGLVIENHQFKDISKAKDYACQLLDIKTKNIYKYASVSIYRIYNANTERLVGSIKVKSYRPVPTYQYLSEIGNIWKNNWVEYKPSSKKSSKKNVPIMKRELEL